jgi:hypothetical protein
MVTGNYSGFKDDGSLIEGEIFRLEALIPRQADGLVDEVPVKQEEIRGTAVTKESTLWIPSCWLQSHSPFLHRTYLFKQITNVQGDTAETFKTRDDG